MQMLVVVVGLKHELESCQYLGSCLARQLSDTNEDHGGHGHGEGPGGRNSLG